MLKEKLKDIQSYVAKHSKIVYPIILILAVALTVMLALGATEDRDVLDNSEEVVTNNPIEDVSTEPVSENVLVRNEDAALYALVCTYYNAYATGDVETIKSISNYMDETDELKIPQMAEYVEAYPTIEIYTKNGPVENSYLAYVYFQMKIDGFEDLIAGLETFYVCTNENGELYLNKGEVTEQEYAYIQEVNLQVDVEELYNRVNVECNDTFYSNADLFYYIQEIVNEVQKSVGESLAAQVAQEEEENVSGGDVSGGDGETTIVIPTPEPTTVYATTTTTVNVRESDSEQASKITKVSGNTRVEVIEQKANGWSNVKVDGQVGYIKSEYLTVIEGVDGSDIIGIVKATTTINVRMLPSQEATKIGVLAEGSTADLLGEEGEWSKISYNGQVAYVKSEYVTK